MYDFECFHPVKIIYIFCYFQLNWATNFDPSIDSVGNSSNVCLQDKKELLSTLLEEIKAEKYYNVDSLDDKDFSYEFLTDIVDNQEVEINKKTFIQTYERLPKHSNPDSVKDELFVKDEKINKFYKRLKGKFDKNVSQSPKIIENANGTMEIQNDVRFYKIKYFQAREMECLHKFWKELIEKKIEKNNYLQEFKKICKNKTIAAHSNTELKWLTYQLLNFLINKIICSSVESISLLEKSTTFEIIIDLCNLLKVSTDNILMNSYIENICKFKSYIIINSDTSGNSEKMGSNTQDYTFLCHQFFPELILVSKIILCEFFIKQFEALTKFFDEAFYNISSLSEQTEQNALAANFYELNLSVLLFVDIITETFSGIEAISEPFTIQSKKYVKLRLVCITSFTIKFYRCFFLKFVTSMTFANEDSCNTNNFEEPSGFCLKKYIEYVKFLGYAFIFNIVDSAFSKEFKILCLDAGSIGLNYFLILNNIKFTNENKKELFLTNYNSSIDLIIQFHVNKYKTFANCSKEELNTINNKKNTLFFLLTLTTFHSEMDFIYQFNILAFLKNHPNFFKEIALKKKTLFAASEEEFSKILYKHEPYYGLYTHKRLIEPHKCEKKFCEQVESIRAYFNNRNSCNSNDDLNTLIEKISDIKFIDETDLQVLRWDFSNIEQLMIYHTSYRIILGRNFISSSRKTLQDQKCPNEKDFEWFLRGSSFAILYYKNILYHEIEREFKEIELNETIKPKEGEQYYRNFGYFEHSLMSFYNKSPKDHENELFPKSSYTNIDKYYVHTQIGKYVINLFYSIELGDANPRTNPNQVLINSFEFSTNSIIDNNKNSSINKDKNAKTYQVYVYQEKDKVYFDKLAEYIKENFSFERKYEDDNK